MNSVPNSYSRLVSDISGLLEQARHSAARYVNAVLTAAYWEIGRRIVEYEQGGQARSEYGEKLLDRLAKDLTAEHGRGFSRSNVAQMRAFYLAWQIVQTPSGQFEARAKCPTLSGKSGKKKQQTPSAESAQALVPFPAPIRHGIVPAEVFILSWSQYARLMSVENPQARAFYESESYPRRMVRPAA